MIEATNLIDKSWLGTVQSIKKRKVNGSHIKKVHDVSTGQYRFASDMLLTYAHKPTVDFKNA